MIFQPRTAFVTCMLLFTLMEEASPIPVMGKENYEGILKKLAAREKKSVELGLEEECKRKYSVNHNYQHSELLLTQSSSCPQAIDLCNIQLFTG